MTYLTQCIQSRRQLADCPVFHLENMLWHSTRRPATEGRMAVLSGQGILVQMTCHETDPKRVFTQPMEMVCKDSAMEAFFTFPPQADACREGFAPSDDDLYFNFEVNANGALYAKSGWGRQGRQELLPEEFAATGVCAEILPDSWSMEFLLPFTLLQRLAGIETLAPGDAFFCNFYKISEDPAIEHYLSYSPIQSEHPNFHLPRFFARALVV